MATCCAQPPQKECRAVQSRAAAAAAAAAAFVDGVHVDIGRDSSVAHSDRLLS
jgi:hypothetical protein